MYIILLNEHETDELGRVPWNWGDARPRHPYPYRGRWYTCSRQDGAGNWIYRLSPKNPAGTPPKG